MSFSGIILRSFQHFKGRLGLLEKKKTWVCTGTHLVYIDKTPHWGGKKNGVFFAFLGM